MTGQSSQRSVTEWIADLKAGDRQAAQRLFDRYFEEVVRLAKQQLGYHSRRAVGADDVAQSVLASLCLRAPEAQFPKLTDRNDLRTLFIAITRHKARDVIKNETRQKRGGGHVRGESVFDQKESDGRPLGIAALLDEGPTPQTLAQSNEQLDRLLEKLDQEDLTGALRQIAIWKLEGYSNDEIARKLDRVERTVERKLDWIRKVWLREVSE